MKMMYRWICVALGAFLGSGCSDSTEPAEYGPAPAPEYGVPVGTIVMDGTVVDGSGTGIPGIEVRFNDGVADTTDATGAWSIDRDYVFIPCAFEGSNPCTIVATDFDGPVNGGPFPPAPFVLDLKQTDPGAGSDLGTWEQHGITIMMDEAVEYGPPVAKMPPAE